MAYIEPMKLAKSPHRKTRINLHADSFNLSSAKTYLGRLVEKAGKGQTVYILRGQRRFILQEVRPIDPIPVRPPGYFSDCYGKQEVFELNQLAKASIVRAPGDLE